MSKSFYEIIGAWGDTSDWPEELHAVRWAAARQETNSIFWINLIRVVLRAELGATGKASLLCAVVETLNEENKRLEEENKMLKEKLEAQ